MSDWWMTVCAHTLLTSCRCGILLVPAGGMWFNWLTKLSYNFPGIRLSVYLVSGCGYGMEWRCPHVHHLQVLDRQDFAELAYHILKGDQLIVRGSDITTVTSIINILKASQIGWGGGGGVESVCVCRYVGGVCGV